MFCFVHRYKLDTSLLINNNEFLIEDNLHYKSIYYLIRYYYSKSLRCIFYGTNQCLFRSDDYIYKIEFKESSKIHNYKSSNFGQIYSIIKLDTGHTVYRLEYIKNMLTKNIVFFDKDIEPFILLYSLTIDYMNALSILHNDKHIHSNIKPINLMINNGIGKLVGLDDIVEIVDKNIYYYYTSGSIDYLAPERFEYFKETGFFGMTSIYSDIWELFYSLLCIIEVVNNDEFFYLLYTNYDLLEFYLINRFVKVFSLGPNSSIMTLLSKYVSLLCLGLYVIPVKRNNADYYLEKLIGYRNI
jgi:serine/threonine protein kinase